MIADEFIVIVGQSKKNPDLDRVVRGAQTVSYISPSAIHLQFDIFELVMGVNADICTYFGRPLSCQ